jgi:hypothetical protein
MVVLVDACVTPLDTFEQISENRYLTVEAPLTDQLEHHRIKLSLSVGNFNGNSLINPITRAKVYVIDERNVREEFLERAGRVEEGVYYSVNRFAGRVGGSYTLFIETTDGKKYQSFTEKMKGVPEIENPQTRFEINNIYERDDPRRAGFNVYVDFQDPPTEGDNYQWYWKHYEKDSICQSCYGGNYDFKINKCVEEIGVAFPQTRHYKCDGNCWSISFSNDINMLSDSYLNGKRITGKQIVRIPFSDFTPYYLQIEQRNITENAFKYYQNLAVQTQGNGTLFDVPAETRFSYNIKCITDPSEKLLGIFNVYSVRKKVFYINRKEVAPIGEVPVYQVLSGEILKCLPNAPCLVPCVEGPNRTKTKPTGWKD